MQEQNTICVDAEVFLREYSKAYLEDRDFPRVISMLSRNVSWFSYGEEKICMGYHQAISLLERQSSFWVGHNKILSQVYTTTQLGSNAALVTAQLSFVQDEFDIQLSATEVFVTAICVREGQAVKLLHGHFSNGNSVGYNSPDIYGEGQRSLAQALQECTRLLKDKTLEVELLTENIRCGVQVCKYEEGFPIQYLSTGFLTMLGYAKEEAPLLLGTYHIDLVYAPDRPRLEDSVHQQFQHGNSFSREYRLICKDGSTIWVLDRGCFLVDGTGQTSIHCTYTDISTQKATEEMLRLTEKRYEVALQASGIAMFEYNLQSKELQFYNGVAEIYGIKHSVPNGVETFIATGVIDPGSVAVYREMYRKIHGGAPTASCVIKTKDVTGALHNFELSLTTVFDNDGTATRAIGVRKNVDQLLKLEQEKKFGQTLISDLRLIVEANVSTNTVEWIDKEFQQETHTQLEESFDALVSRIALDKVYEEHRKQFLEVLSNENLILAADNADNTITMQYRRRGEGNIYFWYEMIASVIRNPRTDEVNLRYYIKNIHGEKLREEQAKEEQQLYALSFSGAYRTYKVNLTQNCVVSGFESIQEKMEDQGCENYETLLEEYATQRIYAQDQQLFLEVFSRGNLLRSYQAGQRQLVQQYRKDIGEKTYHWVKNTTHLYLSVGELMAVSYVEDIDKQKEEELQLKYVAEHDSMTKVRNKASTEQKIKAFLGEAKGLAGLHALLIIDVDYFKYVNDSFGHLFGDGVIQEIAVKILSLFRETDIVGRIGGDEFCVLMKQVGDRSVVCEKAQAVCARICKVYTHGGKACSVSASVGVSFYGVHGETFEELYNCADKALYQAKDNGRNRFEIAKE